MRGTARASVISADGTRLYTYYAAPGKLAPALADTYLKLKATGRLYQGTTQAQP